MIFWRVIFAIYFNAVMSIAKNINIWPTDFKLCLLSLVFKEKHIPKKIENC